MGIVDVEKAVLGVGQALGWYERWVNAPGVTVERLAVDPLLCALDWSTWLPWECQSDPSAGTGYESDWTLFDRDGAVAALVAFNRQRRRRGYDRLVLARKARRAHAMVAVLTSSWLWEMYDFEMRNRRFNDRLALRFMLSAETADDAPEVAEALHRWLSKECWWWGERSTPWSGSRESSVSSRTRS